MRYGRAPKEVNRGTEEHRRRYIVRSLLRTMAGNAAGARAWLAEQDKTNLVLERSDNATGFKNVIKLARGGYQVKPYDSKLKRPRPLPGVWATAEEAAQYYACAKTGVSP